MLRRSSIISWQRRTFFIHFQKGFGSLGQVIIQSGLTKILSNFYCLWQPTLTKQLYLILDAMDESEQSDRRNIIKCMSALCRESIVHYKVFLASRPFRSSTWSKSVAKFIRLQDENKEDIMKVASLPWVQTRPPLTILTRPWSTLFNKPRCFLMGWILVIEASRLCWERLLWNRDT